jgi:hypothetical protein
MPARGRAAPGSSRASPARRSTAKRQPFDSVPLRRTDAGGPAGREARDAGMVASGAVSSPVSPARRSTASRSARAPDNAADHLDWCVQGRAGKRCIDCRDLAGRRSFIERRAARPVFPRVAVVF